MRMPSGMEAPSEFMNKEQKSAGNNPSTSHPAALGQPALVIQMNSL